MQRELVRPLRLPRATGDKRRVIIFQKSTFNRALPTTGQSSIESVELLAGATGGATPSTAVALTEPDS